MVDLILTGAFTLVELGIVIATAKQKKDHENEHCEGAYPCEVAATKPRPCYTHLPPRYTGDGLDKVSIRCHNCTYYYNDAENHESACKHHHGRFNQSSLVPQWTCCKSADKVRSECCVGWHYPSGPEKINSDPNSYEGYMTKQGHIFKTWKTRFFRLSGNTLTYSEDTSDVPLGVIDLRNATVSLEVGTVSGESKQMLKVHDSVNNKSFLLYAGNSEILLWKQKIEEAIERLNPHRVKTSEYNTNEVKTSTFPYHQPPPTYEEAVTQTPYQVPNLYPPPSYGDYALNNVDKGDKEYDVVTPYDDSTPTDMIVHTVLPTDTLAGVALKYNTKAETIKKVNKLTTDAIFTRKILYIPRDGYTTDIPQQEIPESYKRKMAVSKFVRRARVEFNEEVVDEEADFYLESAEWNFDVAFAQWKEDLLADKRR